MGNLIVAREPQLIKKEIRNFTKMEVEEKLK